MKLVEVNNVSRNKELARFISEFAGSKYFFHMLQLFCSFLRHNIIIPNIKLFFFINKCHTKKNTVYKLTLLYCYFIESIDNNM